MSAQRCLVGITLSGEEWFYQREADYSTRTETIVKPYFSRTRSEGAVMPEESGLRLAERLRTLGQASVYLFDLDRNVRIDLPWRLDTTVSYGDNRQPQRATLGEENDPNAEWFVVRPICRPSGRTWFIKAVLPGLGSPQMFYGEPLECLQRASDLNMLQYCEKAPASQPSPQPVVNRTPVVTIRPGSR